MGTTTAVTDATTIAATTGTIAATTGTVTVTLTEAPEAISGVLTWFLMALAVGLLALCSVLLEVFSFGRSILPKMVCKPQVKVHGCWLARETEIVSRWLQQRPLSLWKGEILLEIWCFQNAVVIVG